MQLSAIVTETRQFTELKLNRTLMSTRIMQLATFFQDYNVITNSPPGYIVNFLIKKILGAGILTGPDLFRLLNSEKYLILK